MTTAKPNPIIRAFPSLTDLAFLMPIVYLFVRGAGAKSMLGDGDTGWHIRTGEWILRHGQVPRQDMFSFTKPGAPWFAWEWLWDVVFGSLHQWWGMTAVIMGSLFVISITSVLVFRLVRRKCTNVLIATAVTVLAVAGSSIHWLARPHLFTLLFVMIFYSLLERVNEGRTRLLWLLPPLTVVWTNFHAGFLAGIIVIGCYAGGELAHAIVASEPGPRRAALRRAGLYLLSAAGCLAGSFINPYTYHLHQHIIGYLSDGYLYRTIAEFQTASFHLPQVEIYFEPMIMLGVAAAAWSLYRRRFAYALLIAVWVHMALMSARNIPIFMFMAAPPVALAIQELVTYLSQANVAGWIRRAAASFEGIASEIGETDRIGRLHLVSAGAMILLIAISYAPGAPEKFKAEYDPKTYPAQALDALMKSDSQSRIFTEDIWGGYMIYRCPDKKVFIDGRSDFYGDKFGERYLDTISAKYDWERNLARYSVDTVLLPTDAPLASTLKESGRWRAVYDDGVAIAFRSVTAPAGSVLSASKGDKSFPVMSSGKARDRQITETETQNLKRRPI